VADADAYHTARGNTGLTGTTTVKEQALRRATDFMLQRFGQRWRGRRVSIAQALDFPRYDLVTADGFSLSSNVVPIQVVNACIELALRSLTETLIPDENASSVVSESVTLPGPLSKSTTYAGGKTSAKRYSSIELMLRNLTVDLGQAERS
jgi:hypothetical protein